MAPARENAGAASRRACASVPATVTAWLREAGPRPVRPDARPRPLADPARAAMLRDMSAAVRNSIEPPPGFRSQEIGLYLAQLDDQSRRLTADTRGLEVGALAWQPAPGMNTIGMLLAHIAIVEVFWTRLALEDRPMPFEVHDVLGVGLDDDGMPLKADARPPAGLAGRELGFFDDLLARARARS